MIKITREVRNALHELKFSLPNSTNKELGKKIGLSEPHIGRIFSGEIKEVRSASWNVIKTQAGRFLTADAIDRAERGFETEPPIRSAIPEDLIGPLEIVSADIDVPVSSMVPALLKALIMAHKAGTIESIWPPRLAIVPKEGNGSILT